MKRVERIPLHNHRDIDSGGRISSHAPAVTTGSSTSSTSAPTATQVSIADVGGNFDATNVETALAELATGYVTNIAVGELLVADVPLDFPLGTFMTTAHQTVGSTTTAYAVAFAAEGDVDGLTHSTVTNNSRIYVQQSGEYNIIASAIADETAADKTHMDLWLAIDGTNVADSNTRVEIATKEVEQVMAVAFTRRSRGRAIRRTHVPRRLDDDAVRPPAAASSPTRPASPAVIPRRSTSRRRSSGSSARA